MKMGSRLTRLLIVGAVVGVAMGAIFYLYPNIMLQSTDKNKASYLKHKQQAVHISILKHAAKTAGVTYDGDAISPPSWVANLYSLVDKSQDANTFVIAHCFYNQADRTFDPLGHSKYFAEFAGPHISPLRTKIEYRAVIALPKFLPDGVEPTSKLGLTLLGLSSDVHLRVCSFGSTDIMKTLNSVPGVVETTVQVKDLVDKLKQLGLYWQNLSPGEVPAGQEDYWSHDAMLYWPLESKVRFPTLNGKPFGPFIPRFNKEPWYESVRGVTTQFDTKRTMLPRDSITVYYPMIIDTMSWRLTANEYPNHWSARVGFLPPEVKTIKQALTRAEPYTIPAPQKKPYFATFVNSHCGDNNAYLKSVSIREAFVFTMAEQLNRPVHLLGNCPLRHRERAGLRNPQASVLRTKSAVEAMRAHKFAIVFENSRTSGYISEKIVNAYLAETIPIYFGAEFAQLELVLNPKAFIHCDLPTNMTDISALNELTIRTCSALKLKMQSRECHDAYVKALELSLKPYMSICIAKVQEMDQNDDMYKAMLREPLIHLDPATGEPTGIFSGKTYGTTINILMQAFGYNL